MYRSSNRYRILQLFFDQPNHKFQLREIERKTKIGFPSVRNHVRELMKREFLEELDEGVYKGYALAKNRKAMAYKRNDLLVRLEEIGLLNEIEEKTQPNCIILYGSAIDGRDDERGDIDLYVQAKQTRINTDEYEEKIARKISLLFEPNTAKLTKELLNNLANGITLRGYLKVR